MIKSIAHPLIFNPFSYFPLSQRIPRQDQCDALPCTQRRLELCAYVQSFTSL